MEKNEMPSQLEMALVELRQSIINYNNVLISLGKTASETVALLKAEVDQKLSPTPQPKEDPFFDAQHLSEDRLENE